MGSDEDELYGTQEVRWGKSEDGHPCVFASITFEVTHIVYPGVARSNEDEARKHAEEVATDKLLTLLTSQIGQSVLELERRTADYYVSHVDAPYRAEVQKAVRDLLSVIQVCTLGALQAGPYMSDLEEAGDVIEETLLKSHGHTRATMEELLKDTDDV